MNKLLFKKSFLVFAFLFFQSAFAQLPDFTLGLTKTDETCTGNGKIFFTVANTTAGSAIVYSVYLLPNTTTPIASTSAASVDGLAAGNYLVTATQTLGNDSNSEQQNITINDLVVPLTYYLSGSSTCNNGSISVDVNQGTAVGYEIISGPVIRPMQSSNVFSNLPVGEYVIRVHDACGDAVVQTFTLVNPPANFTLTPLDAGQCALIDCNTISLFSTLSAVMGSISYPLTIQYTVHPPTGLTMVLTQTVNSGDPIMQDIMMNLPYFNNQAYSVDVVVTDNCGYVTTSSGNPVNEKFNVTLLTTVTICERNLLVEACNFVAPVTVVFITAPAGFNPNLFNPQHPGPITDLPFQYVSTGSNELPQGNYVIQLTDACGRTAQATYQLQHGVEPKYIVVPSCGFGQVSMPGPNGSMVASVIITAAPAALGQPLPYNVSFNITEGHFLMDDLPSGTYTFEVVNICGDSYTYEIVIPPSGQQPVLINYIKGCDQGYTSIKLSIQNSAVTSVVITAAPSGFSAPLPYNATANIAAGMLFMNDLPQGIYSFLIQDNCGGSTNITIQTPEYTVTSDVVEVDHNCGSFNILLDYTTNETAAHEFWLQKYDPVSGQWMHPFTGAVYTDGTTPTLLNSYALVNHVNNINIASIGTFRVLRVHKIYANGSSAAIPCIREIKNFIFTGGPRITGANLLPCISNPGQVAIIAEGLAPLTYFITAKDGQQWFVNNGNSNIFSGLAPGIYNFQVRDVCQNIVNRLLDLGSIPQPAISQSVLCDGQNGNLSIQGFNYLNFQWWNSNNPNVILSTANTLNFAPFSSALHSGTYIVRIYSTQPTLCTDQTVSFTIPVSSGAPNAGSDTVSDLCGNSGTIDLFDYLGGAYQTGGTWQEITSSGMQIGHSWLPVNVPYGTYKFKYTVNGLCAISDEAEVTIHFSPLPAAPAASSDPTVCTAGTIALFASDVAGANYTWTGPNGFTSSQQNPTIVNPTMAASGTYSVIANIGNCQSPTATVVVNVAAAPDFTIAYGCDNNAYKITAKPILPPFDSGVSFSWTGPDNFTSSENQIAITGGAKGTYSLTVTTGNGCSVTHSVAIATTNCGAIPSGISPNGDGANEFLDLTGLDILKLKIFSRYGNIVFEQDDYTTQWHGQDKKGRELPDATYFYYVKFKTGEERTGWVYVTR